MPMYFPPWDTDNEPHEGNIKIWCDNVYGKYEPLEQARWNQSNIDTRFYAGDQNSINNYFNFSPGNNKQNYHFNFIQQPINMVTGYQRQHRKSITYTPVEGSKQDYADDLTKTIMYANKNRNILSKFSTGCEQSCIAGMVLAQPYLDYTDDPINGTLDLKIWSYNSFMVDPYFREPDMSDANFVWCQQYCSKMEAKDKFPNSAGLIGAMSGYGNRVGKFYFLPENYNLARNDLLVLSHIWYKSKRLKKMLYNRNDGIAYDYTDDDQSLGDLVQATGFFEIIEVQVPTWKLAVMCNDHLMYNSLNPLGFDECPFVPIYWNYDPHIAQYDLRVRSLTRSMRDSQFLLNRRVILNHDISESSINSGYKRKENSVANEEVLRQAGQGYDIIIKDGYDMADVEKIIPNAVPASDMQLAEQLADFIFRTSGVNQELMGMADDSKTGIEIILKQGAGLVTLQKYFDQWDLALQLVGIIEQKIIQNKWSPAKIARILGKEPDPQFLNKTFSKYGVVVAEGLDTAVQQQFQFRQAIELNNMLGGIIPPKFLLGLATIQGKNEIIEAVEQQQKEAAEMQKEQAMLEHAKIEAELGLLHARATSEVATARERHGRAESNIGLFEERLSEISQNRSIAVKNKVEALQKLIETVELYGDKKAAKSAQSLEVMSLSERDKEDREKDDARLTEQSNDFLTNLSQNNQPQNTMGQEPNGSGLL